MEEHKLNSIASLSQFIQGSHTLNSRVLGGESDRQGHVERVLKRFEYARLPKSDKGVVLQYLCLTSGYSRQHLTKLVRRYKEHMP